MDYIDHDHKHTVKRGGSIMSGNSNYDDDVVLDTPEYSKHDLSHTWKGTAKMGVINVPLNLHVLAGDSLRISPNISQRFRPLVAPITGSIETVQHTWYVPYRKCDYGFAKMLTGGVSGTYKTNLLHFIIPNLTGDKGPDNKTAGELKCFGVPLFAAGSLFDQMNFGHRSAVLESSGVMEDDYLRLNSKPSILSLVAYHRVYNDFYRPKEVETDLWCEIEQPVSLLNYFTKLYNALHAANSSITWTASLWTDSIMETIWSVLRTNADFTGFGHYMLWLLSSPDAVPVLASYYGVDYPSGQTNASYNRSNHRLILNGLLKTRVHQNTVGYCIDFFAAIFNAYLICPEFFPWERDRFTSALPYLMRGQQVALETALVAASPVNSIGSEQWSESGDSYHLDTNKWPYTLVGKYNTDENVELATGFSIQELRRVNAWTRFLERNARIGYVFDEWLEGIFGIATKKSDHLTRPVYVGGSIQNADVETIMSTAETTDANIGDYRGYATSYGGGSYDFSVAEPGVVLGLLATRPRSTYLNTCDRNNFKYGDRTLFFTPDFAHLTEQPIFSAEIDSMTGDNFSSWLNDDWNDEDEEGLDVGVHIFGYEPRYNEYRSMPSTTHGELKTSLAYFSNARTGYDWLDNLEHIGNEIPNDVFFQHVFPDSEAVNRIFQVSGDMADHFVLSVGWSIDSLRVVPRQATPSL